jgi:hypothetical protein
MRPSGTFWRKSVLAAGLAVLCHANDGAAHSVSPYAPLNLAPELERDLERVLILAGQPVMRRPLPLGLVAIALPAACARDAALCARVRHYLQRVAEGGLTLASAELAATNQTVQPLPDLHGMASDSAWAVAATYSVQPSDYFLASAGAVLDGTHTTPASLVSFGVESAQVDVGYRDRWLSPLTDSSMMISTEAAAMPSVTVSNWRPLTRFGLTYEVFLAEMSHSNTIAYNSGYTSGSPRLTGLQLSISPWAGWSVAVNRLVQFGGGARGGNSLNDVLRALFNPHGYDNSGSSTSTNNEEGNQLASLTSRLLFPGRTPFAVYAEYAGEDTSHASNYRLGNAALAAGIDFPLLPHGLNATFEITEWQNGWYVNHNYGDGLTNHGNVLGNWFGDWRRPGDAVGGNQQMLRVGWQSSTGRETSLRYRTMANASYTDGDYRRGHEVSLSYSQPWRGVRIGASLDAGRNVYGDNFGRLAGFVRFDDSSGPYTDPAEGPASAADDVSDRIERLLDVGFSTTRINFESSAQVPDTTSPHYQSPHLGIGARRAASARQDLGMRLELDRVNGYTLLALRALDYRYRWGGHFALSTFVGVARYETGAPAYGYYLGAGAQWRNLFPHLDLSVDWRYGDKLARDSLLPGDPPQTARPDM